MRVVDPNSGGRTCSTSATANHAPARASRAARSCKSAASAAWPYARRLVWRRERRPARSTSRQRSRAVVHLHLPQRRAEPLRDVRSQAERPDRHSRALRHHPDQRARHPDQRAVAADRPAHGQVRPHPLDDQPRRRPLRHFHDFRRQSQRRLPTGPCCRSSRVRRASGMPPFVHVGPAGYLARRRQPGHRVQSVPGGRSVRQVQLPEFSLSANVPADRFQNRRELLAGGRSDAGGLASQRRRRRDGQQLSAGPSTCSPPTGCGPPLT